MSPAHAGVTGSDVHPEVREVAGRLIESLGADLAALLWHGSFARGEAKPDSDHDMIIVLKRIDDDILLRMREVFRGHANWSTFVQSEEELRQWPPNGRSQFHFGLRVLYGEIEPPPWTRENVLADLRALARDIRFECRYRLLHKGPESVPGNTPFADFQRHRNLRMLGYAAKWAVLAMKAREALEGRPYPVTQAELRERLADPDDLAVLDMIDAWPRPRESYQGDLADIALKLDAFARRLVSYLGTAG